MVRGFGMIMSFLERLYAPRQFLLLQTSIVFLNGAEKLLVFNKVKKAATFFAKKVDKL